MSNPVNVYRQTRIKTAGQGRLIIMLYDEGLQQMALALEELNQKEPQLERVHNALVKAQDIITELMVSLDFDRGGEIASNLFNLYVFFNQKLVDANMKKEVAGIHEVQEMMEELRDAWVAIQNKAIDSRTAASTGGVNLAG